MIKKIIACSDIHIRNYNRADEYVSVFKKFFREIDEIVSEYGKESVRIVITGDLFHGKIDISCEGYVLASWFLMELGKRCKTYVIAGNHDMNMNNMDRLDSVSALFSMCKFNNVIYLDRELGYSSGVFNDDNINWHLYSSFDSFSKPETDVNLESGTNIALFHGVVQNAKSATGYVFEDGVPSSYFEGTDFGILGHIHKIQVIKNDGNPYVYCGSLIQQDNGESVNNHGYILWDVDEQDYEIKNIANEEYGFYTFAISSVDDILNDKEEIVNL